MRIPEYLQRGSYGLVQGMRLKEKYPASPLEGVSDNPIYACRRCERYGKAGLPVSPQGSWDAKVVLVGACPGRMEVEHQRPFYERAPGGSLMVTYLHVLKLVREECYVTNCCYCLDYQSGVKDRLPTEEEEALCSPWKVYEMYYLHQVEFVILFGKNAVRQALGSSFPSPTMSNGKIVKANVFGRVVNFGVCHHPGYILRRPGLWDETKKVLQKFRRKIEI